MKSYFRITAGEWSRTFGQKPQKQPGENKAICARHRKKCQNKNQWHILQKIWYDIVENAAEEQPSIIIKIKLNRNKEE